jgi:hypothetical protein
MRGSPLLRSGVRPLRGFGLALVVALLLAVPPVAVQFAPATAAAAGASGPAAVGAMASAARGDLEVIPTPPVPPPVRTRHLPSFGDAPYGVLILFATALAAAILAWRARPPRTPRPPNRPPHRNVPFRS